VIGAGAVTVAQAGGFGVLERWFVGFIDATSGGPLFAIGAVLAAVAIGAGHALAPGHGKGVTAAYLVGARGRPRDALALGGVVALMHTGSVLALGLVLFGLSRTPTGGESVGGWMTLASGLLVTAVGAGLAWRHLRRHRHDHDHDHLEALPPGVAPLSRRGLVLLGMSGGLLPSPSAFLVLATGLFTERVGSALALVAAFSVGLAGMLTVIGLVVLRGRDALLQRAGRSARLARLAAIVPTVAAVAVLAGGVWLTATAAMRL
jgi:ABC-type nickel/cobalt efflux system permease component RcnA